MVKRGSNFIPLVLDTRLLMAINGKASQNQQLNATYIMKLVVEHCKDDLEPEAYKELLERYSKTVYEQRQKKLAEKEAKLKREEEKLKLKREELKLAKQNSKAYVKAVDLGNQKRIEELEDNIEGLQNIIEREEEKKINKPRLFNPQILEDAKKSLAENKQKISDLQTQK